MKIIKMIVLITSLLFLVGCSQSQQSDNNLPNKNDAQSTVTDVFNKSAMKLKEKENVAITIYSACVDWNHLNNYKDANNENFGFTGVYAYDITSIDYDNKNTVYTYDFFTNYSGILDIDHSAEYFDTYANNYCTNNDETLPLNADTIKIRMDWMKNNLLEEEGYLSRYIIKKGEAKKYIGGSFEKDLKFFVHGADKSDNGNYISSQYNESILDNLSKSDLLGDFKIDIQDEDGDNWSTTYNAFFPMRFSILGTLGIDSYITNQSKVDEDTILTLNLNVDSTDYKESLEIAKNTFDFDGGTKEDELGSYLADAKVKITIDESGYLKKYEYVCNKSFLNENLKDIKVPETFIVEFK